MSDHEALLEFSFVGIGFVRTGELDTCLPSWVLLEGRIGRILWTSVTWILGSSVLSNDILGYRLKDDNVIIV